MKSGNSIFANVGTSIFEVMSRLAIQHKSINLGQGFPDNNGPDDVRKVAHEALEDRPNQYPPMMGVPELRQAVAAHNKRFYGIDVDWQTETLVTSGATEALSGCIFGLVEPGDEVVVFEPLYDSYLPILRRAGATPKLVRLEPPHWEIPRDKLTAAFSAKTKMILLNTPMNPAAKVFTRDELSLIAELCLKHDALAVCDEVYEHIIFDGRPHVPLMTLPGMRDRTIRIGSAGKTFSLTGWKVGYLTGAPGVLGPAARVHQFLTFTTPPNLQRATAYGLGKDDAYFRGLAGGMQAQRDRLGSGLKAIGFDVVDCAGTYFITCDFRPVVRRWGFNGDDVEFCKKMTEEGGVTAIPVSAFYQGDAPRYFIRFAFCKQPQIIDAALEKMAAFLTH
ncbi:MAG: aminotransferase [Alphaproteobacteria bacterium]